MIMNFFQIIAAEAVKQYRSTIHSTRVLFSLLIWPVIEFFTIYYIYKPFLDQSYDTYLTKWVNQNSIFIFVLLGSLGYIIFYSFVNSSRRFSFERVMGTLELIYMSPANRLAILIGNSIVSLIQSVFLFGTFACSYIIIFSKIDINNPILIFIAFLVLIISSISWGIFLNAIFIFSRDTGIFYVIFQAPMQLLSGVKVPYKAMPLWSQIIGAVFPLTWSLKIMRSILCENADFRGIAFDLIIVGAISAIYVMLTVLLLRLGENHMKKNGNMNLI